MENISDSYQITCTNLRRANLICNISAVLNCLVQSTKPIERFEVRSFTCLPQTGN